MSHWDACHVQDPWRHHTQQHPGEEVASGGFLSTDAFPRRQLSISITQTPQAKPAEIGLSKGKEERQPMMTGPAA
jgi:hypothetical protein